VSFSYASGRAKSSGRLAATKAALQGRGVLRGTITHPGFNWVSTGFNVEGQ